MIITYFYFSALLACGIVNTGVRNDCDPALALLSDYVDHSSAVMTIGAIFGLGLAYAGSNREDLVELLLPVFTGMYGISTIAFNISENMSTIIN